LEVNRLDSRKFVIHKTLLILLGQAICVAIMLGIFALLDRFDRSVVLGGIFGGLISTANFFFMAVGAMLAADKAEQQNVKGGQATIQASYIGRLAVMALILFALVKSGLCDVFAVVLPLAFNRPILTLTEFFRKEDKV
jgi:hypothetical protein